MADFDRTASIRRLAGNAFERIIFDPNLNDHQPHTIICGVVFVHAFWAGSSVRGLAEFCKSVVRVDTERRLLFVVCDIDNIPVRDPRLFQGDNSGGNGDVFWISDGRVVARHMASRSCDFDTANQSLIQWCGVPRPVVRIAATTNGNGVTIACTGVRESGDFEVENLSRVPRESSRYPIEVPVNDI